VANTPVVRPITRNLVLCESLHLLLF